jgi:putative membrane protein
MVSGMTRLSDSERQAIEATIRAVEQTTTAEFVAVVARRAERHHAASLTAGLVAALVAGIAVAWLDPWAPIAVALVVQCLVFAIVYALGEQTPLGAWLAPRHMRQLKVRRLARLIFFDRGLGHLPARNGVLLLVALAERQVEIVADHGIDQLAGTAEWQRIVDGFTAKARSDQVAAALEATLKELGAVLARHFPAEPGNVDHVPDRLIEL